MIDKSQQEDNSETPESKNKDKTRRHETKTMQNKMQLRVKLKFKTANNETIYIVHDLQYWLQKKQNVCMLKCTASDA